MWRVLRATLGGKQWTVRRVKRIKDAFADCDPGRRLIRIECEHKGRDLLVFLLHEGLHACYPRASERSVTRSAEELADLVILAGLTTEECKCE